MDSTPEGRFKVNFDAALDLNTGASGVGAVIRGLLRGVLCGHE